MGAYILPICRKNGLFEGSAEATHHAKAEVIATFACCCAPSDASSEGIRLAARITAIFFFLNDIQKSELHPIIRQMQETLHGSSRDELRPQAHFLEEYLEEIAVFGDTTLFRRQLEHFMESLLVEAAMISKGSVSHEEYRRIRHKIIFVEEYIWSWFLSERVPLSPAAYHATAALRRLASEVVYLVNDIGSIERERAAGCVDPNLVFIMEKEHGLGADEALTEVIRIHNETAVAFKKELERLNGPGGTVETSAIADVVDSVVAGNLETSKRLSHNRYPGSYDALSRLVF